MMLRAALLLIVLQTLGATWVVPNASAQDVDPAPPAEQTQGPVAGGATVEPATPPDIFAVMLEAGYTSEVDQDLADYLPIPPRADGQVGRFLIDGEIVALARVTYAEVVFADPHERWILERMALLPEAHERVVRQGATIIHIRAESERRADEVRDLFLELGASETPTDGGS